MTHSPPPTNEKPTPARSRGAGYVVLVLIFRILLLSVGGSIALLIGIAIAMWRPGVVNEPPVLERALRWVSVWRSGEIYVPPGSSPDPIEESGPLPLDLPDTNSTEATPSPGTNDPADTDSGSLPPSDRDRSSTELESEPESITNDLEELQTDVNNVRDRLGRLEEQLEVESPATTIDERLTELEQIVNDRPTNPSRDNDTATTAIAPDAPNASPSNELPLSDAPSLSPDTLRVTLPSDSLFEPDNVQLRDEVGPLLDSIATELKTYPTATIRISVHTDDQAPASVNRALSFARSQEVRDYLAPNLGDRYRLVAIGYGASRPLIPNTSPEAQQRNRRVEITIDPHS
jgi:outer membrane protein OmpA-like peptidoglycan-associated protein